MAPTKTKLVFELPKFDTGQYGGSEFLMRGGNATLTIRIDELSFSPIIFEFRRVRWHQFTSLYLCSAEMIKGSYFRLTEIASREVDEFRKKDRHPPYKELHHFRIFLDETGCHEVFAEHVSMHTSEATKSA